MNADREQLIEHTLAAHRERDPRGAIQSSPAFFDLTEHDRLWVFEETLRHRALERAVDPDGLSGTVRAVLARLAR